MTGLQHFPGTVAIVVPHQDDETLGCGGLIALLAGQRDVHVLFATDGSRSPIPEGAPHNPALVATREDEARAALATLGVPAECLHFLRFPDGDLSEHEAECRRSIEDVLGRVSPATVLVPFRYDWHADHIAAYRIVAEAHASGRIPGALVEYFVYTQRRLLPGGDVRACLAPEHTWHVDISDVVARKRKALECYRSQTTRYFDWQRRPILPPDVLDRACVAHEVFLPSTPRLPTRAMVPSSWVAMATKLEPRLKRTKDDFIARLRR